MWLPFPSLREMGREEGRFESFSENARVAVVSTPALFRCASLPCDDHELDGCS